MNITEAKVFLRRKEEGKLRAYATITFDDAFVVRDLKVIEGNKGLFVAMPSRKLRQMCPHCGHRNVVGSKFCNQCGNNIEALIKKSVPGVRGEEGSDSEHRDIAHPITPQAREYIQTKILEAYRQQKELVQDSPTPPPSSPDSF